MHNRLALAVAVLALAGGLASAGDTCTLSGTFTNSTLEDGTTVFVRLIDAGTRCLDPRLPRYATSATFADGKASYSIEGIAEGEYTACAFFDLATEEGPVSARERGPGRGQDGEDPARHQPRLRRGRLDAPAVGRTRRIRSRERPSPARPRRGS